MKKQTKLNLFILLPTMVVALVVFVLLDNYVGSFPTKIVALAVLVFGFFYVDKLRKAKNNSKKADKI